MLNLQRRKLFDTAQVNFSRASAAYSQSGLKILNNIPRYEWGRWQNLLPKNISDIEINTDGYVPLISGSAGCTISRDVSEHWEGNASLKAVTDGVNPMAGFMTNQYAKVKGLSQYILSGYFKGGGDLLYYISWLDINQTTISQASVHVNPSSTWKRFSLSATAPASAVYALLLVRTATNQAVTWWIDGLQIEEVLPGQTVPSPWRPGGTGKAIMIEEGTTNLIPITDQKFEGTWASYNGAVITLTQNQSVSEWSASDATRVRTSGGTNVLKYIWASAGSPASGVIQTGSVWVKNQGAGVIKIGTTSNKVTSVNPGDSLRISYTQTYDGVAASQMRLEAANVNDSMDVIMWRPQLEAKPYATSWTDGTRVGEEVIVTLNENTLSCLEGSAELWIKPTNMLTESRCILGFSTDAVNRFDVWLISGNKLRITCGDTTVNTTTVLAANAYYLVVMTWKDSAIKLYVNGTLITTVNKAAVIKGYIRLGAYGSTLGYISNCLFDNLRISNIARTDAEILAAYNANAPLTADQYTTCLLDFDDSLELKQGLIVPDRFKVSQAVNL